MNTQRIFRPGAACALFTCILLAGCDAPHEVVPEGIVAFDHMDPAAHPRGVTLLSTPDYARVDDATASETPGSLHLSITPGGRPPRRVQEVFGGNAVFGYAWVDLDTGMGVAATIHPSFRDSRQNPWGWHTHVVQLGAGAGDANFCLVSASPNTPGGIAIRPREVVVNIAKAQAGLSAGDLDAAAAFVVAGEAACPSGLGVLLTDDPVGL